MKSRVRGIDHTEYLRAVELRRDNVSSFEEYPRLLEAMAIAWGFNPEGGSKNAQSFGADERLEARP